RCVGRLRRRLDTHLVARRERALQLALDGRRDAELAELALRPPLLQRLQVDVLARLTERARSRPRDDADLLDRHVGLLIAMEHERRRERERDLRDAEERGEPGVEQTLVLLREAVVVAYVEELR